MGLFRSIATFGGFTLVSRVTGFLRDMVLASYLGAGLAADAFFVAFKLPNLFRSLFAEGAFTSAFVPMLSQKMEGDGKSKAVVFASAAISVLTFFIALFVIAVEIFMPYVVQVLAPGFAGDVGKLELATTLSRITFPFLLFVSIVSFQSGILNSLGKFAATASVSIILNLIMVVSVFLFMPFGISPAVSVSYGVTIAGVLEIMYLFCFLRKENVAIRPQIGVFKLLQDKDIRTLFRRIAPGILGAGVYQFNMAVDTILVSLVGTGAISWLYYANRIQQLPLGVVGAAISVTVLPVLSRCLKSGDVEEAKNIQDKAMEYGALLSIPAAVAIIALAEPIVNLLFQHGKFGALETQMTMKAVIAYSIGLPSYVFVKALTPNFFARGDTKTPVKYSLVVLFANLSFAVLLMKPYGHVGIAMATTLASFVSLYQYLHGLEKRQYWCCSRALFKKGFKILLCSLFMGMVMVLASAAFDLYFGGWLRLSFGGKSLIFVLLCILGVASFAFAVTITKVLNLAELANALFSRGRKNA